MYLEEPVVTSLPGFHATRLTQVASFCKLQRLQDSSYQLAHDRANQQFYATLFRPEREAFHRPAAIHAEIQLLCISQQADTVGEKSKYKKDNKVSINAPFFFFIEGKGLLFSISHYHQSFISSHLWTTTVYHS